MTGRPALAGCLQGNQVLVIMSCGPVIVLIKGGVFAWSTNIGLRGRALLRENPERRGPEATFRLELQV